MIFRGFTETTVLFLRELAANNNKEWFEKNRKTYEQHILVPLKQLANDLGPTVKSFDERIDTTPQLNKTVSKIYRDIRFSTDKTPYRTDQWVSYKRPSKYWGNVPEFFFYFTPEEFHIGMGFYQATPGRMQQFKDYIDKHPDKFESIIRQLSGRKEYLLNGDDYKRKMVNRHTDIFQPWYQKKSFFICRSEIINHVFFSSGLGLEIKDGFRLSADMYNFIIDSINE